ncbi:MAG: leucine-rich repeat protein [Lachnospiraceae bacterium]|nr:leucine-rich repeat protein [Lachnospiraceae bacterium]
MKKRIISVLMAAVMLLSLAPTAHAQANASAAPLDGSRQQAYLQAAVTPSVPSGEKDSVLLPAAGTVGKDGMIEIVDQTEMFSLPISETDYYNMLRQGKEELSLSSHIHDHVQPASRQFNMRANYTLPANWTAEANIPRWKWLQNLEVVFDLYAEAADYPDNYYSDLSEGDAYYDVIMIAVSHGLLEEEAGDPVNPTAPATRDFAAHTLSFCLGSIPEKDSFDFSDSAASQWPEDAQVAVERGWLALSGGSFLPENALTAEEVSTMLADAEATLADRDMSQESSQYRLADWVIKLPDTVTVTANWDENLNQSLIIEGYTGTLNAGDTFAYEEDGFPMVYGVASVSQSGNILTVVPQDAAEGALLEMEYVGSITPELKPMLLSNSAVQFDTHEYGTVTAGKIYAAKGNSKSSISFNRSISSIPGLNGIEGTLKAEVSDIKIEKKFIGSQKKFSVAGKVEFSCTVSFTAAKCDVHVPMGGVYIGSVAYFGLDLRFKVDATVGFKSSYSFEFGLDHKKGKYDIIKNVSSNKDFAFTLDGKASLTLGLTGKIDFGIIGKVDARVSIGPEGAASYKEYASGNPRKCLTLSAYLYAGFKLSIDFGKLFTYDYSKPFWNEKNSPYRLYEHREDGLVVTECTRGKEAPSSTSGDPAPRAASKFTTPATSRRFSTSSKIANSTGKNNRGEIVVIWETEEQEDGSVWITGYNGNAVFLTIPETIDGKTVTGIGYGVFQDRTEIQQINIPDSVTSIGNHAFANTGLTSLALPKSLEEIGSYILSGTEGVTEITIPKSVKTMNGNTGWYEPGALSESSVEILTFEEGTTQIPGHAAAHAFNLKKVNIPDSVTEIGWLAFYGCSALEGIKIADSVTTIGEAAFEGCSALTDIVLPDSLTTIDGGVFRECISLKTINIPDSVTSIGDGVFSNCSSLVSAKFKNAPSSIPEKTFFNCTDLETVNIPDSVTTIEDSAFSECVALKAINLPKGLVRIKGSAFKNCDALESLVIPDSATSLGSSAFHDCDGLQTVSLGMGLTEIPASCFEHCDSLASIILPHSITEIDTAAFKNCIKLTSVTIPRNTSSISSDAFSYKHKLTIYGVNGTYAETYAKENSITFVGIEKKAQSVQFSADTIEMEVYDRKTLALTVTPSDCTDEIKWTSSNSEIVSVKENGEVEAKKPGTAVITVSVGDLTASCEVRVIRLIYRIYFNEYEKSLAVGDTYSIQAYISPDDATYQALQWSSSDESVAAVDQEGVVTAKKVGEATITAKSQDGSDESADCLITVTDVLIDSISLETYVLNMEVSETYPLTVIVSPSNASNKQLHWESSDESVVSVTQEGIVTAHKKGEAKITVSALDGSGSSDYCNVSVNAANICHSSADLESMHPYDDYSNETWIYQVEGASSITLTFDEQTETEADYDYIEIYNAEGELVGSYSGWELAGETVSVPGDTVKIKLTSDSGYNAWGFKVTEAFATIAGVTTPSDKDMKEAAAITDENTDVVMDVEKQEGEADPADVERIEKEVDENLEVVSSFDVKMFAVEYDAEGKEISREPITQLNKPVLLTFVTPGEAGKTYQVVRIHVNEKGEVEVALLPTTDNGDGTVSAESDKFSMYYVVEKKEGQETNRLPGDVNDDGQVTLMDLVRLCKYLAGYEVDIHEQNSDVNGDGNVTLMDLVRLCKHLAGYDVVLE